MSEIRKYINISFRYKVNKDILKIKRIQFSENVSNELKIAYLFIWYITI
jgi:hypothetical protein